MRTMKLPWLPLLVGLVAIGLPVAAHQLRHSEALECDLDGTAIVELYRVDVVTGDGKTQSFCCPRCARLWLHRRPAPLAITVRDEITGDRLSASKAWYVRSSVRTSNTNGNRIHVFARRADAEKHASTFLGGVLPQSESPFDLSR